MDPLKILSFQILLSVVLIANGKRNFKILLDGLNCTVNPSYVQTSQCYINKTTNTGYLDFQMHREIKATQYDVNVLMIKNNNERFTLYNSKENDGCVVYNAHLDITMLNIIRDIIKNSGKMPDGCPIDKDFHYVFHNITLDAEQFPPYVPEAQFISELIFHDMNKDFIFHTAIYGHVVQNTKNRWLGIKRN